MSTKVPRNAPCPCGSGRKYKHCCIDKGFTWVQTEDGDFARDVPASPAMQAVLTKARADFIEKHGRPPGPDDPVFEGELEHAEHEMVQAMKRAGIPPAFIYAYEKTGRIVTEDNQHLIPTADLEAHQAAIEEWHEIHGTQTD